MTYLRLIFTLLLVAIGSLIIASLLGSTPLPAGRFISALIGSGEINDRIVIWEIRMPRAIAAFVVGAALGLSGAALQALLRNPLAEPGVLGVSAFSVLGATLVLFYGVAAISPILVPLAAIAGAFIATGILLVAAIRTSSVVTLILIGVGLSSFAGALMALLLNLAPNPFALSDLITWTLGSVANKSMSDLTFVLPFIIIGTGVIYAVRRELSALTLGEETTFGLGVDLKHTRLATVLGTGLLTGAAVSIAGAIGFVGIVAPHIVRPMVQFRAEQTLLPSALLGGIMLVIADIGVRLIPSSTELRLGVVAALIGAPIFVWIAIKRRAGNG